MVLVALAFPVLVDVPALGGLQQALSALSLVHVATWAPTACACLPCAHALAMHRTPTLALVSAICHCFRRSAANVAPTQTHIAVGCRSQHHLPRGQAMQSLRPG